MGYDLHITRKEYWFDEEQNAKDISLDEWLSYIHSSGSELELVDTNGEKISEVEASSQIPPGFSEWTAHPQDERPWFDFSDGDISTKNPDEPTVKKMISIAKEFNVKVQGDQIYLYLKDVIHF